MACNRCTLPSGNGLAKALTRLWRRPVDRDEAQRVATAVCGCEAPDVGGATRDGDRP